MTSEQPQPRRIHPKVYIAVAIGCALGLVAALVIRNFNTYDGNPKESEQYLELQLKVQDAEKRLTEAKASLGSKQFQLDELRNEKKTLNLEIEQNAVALTEIDGLK